MSHLLQRWQGSCFCDEMSFVFCFFNLNQYQKIRRKRRLVKVGASFEQRDRYPLFESLQLLCLLPYIPPDATCHSQVTFSSMPSVASHGTRPCYEQRLIAPSVFCFQDDTSTESRDVQKSPLKFATRYDAQRETGAAMRSQLQRDMLHDLWLLWALRST